MKDILCKANSFPSPVAPALLHDYTDISMGLWWENQEFPSLDIIPPWFSMPIFHLRDEQ
jgi:hypothetical protein